MRSRERVRWRKAAPWLPIVLAALSLPAAGLERTPRPGQEIAAAPVLTCNAGPIIRQYGGTSWLVYGCDDEHSVLLVTAADNPAAPFWFMFQWQDSSYRLYGEGTGDKTGTDAAYVELRRLSAAEIAHLPARIIAP